MPAQPLSCDPVGYNLFQRRASVDAEITDFAATVASMPPGLEPSCGPAESSAPPDSEPAAPDSATLDSQPASVDATVEHSPTLSHIGRYAIKGPLGRGGLGQVHEAWDPMLSRTVAIKTLQFDIEMADRESLDGLFLNEARAAAGLNHLHIVTIHDAGLSAHGVYIAMERLYGRDLRQALAAGWQPSPGEAAQLVRRVAEALAYAHARGVVHCDIKPANIFLCQRNKPKVLDFGIARVAHSAALPLLDGLVAGSPHYLAPEQLQGSAVDARTDIHALGVVFYELLAGRKAYSGDSVEQITNAVLTNHPAPAHEVRAGVPPALSAIAARAMARDPAERYSTAAAMAVDLRRWVDRHSANEPAPLASIELPALEPACVEPRSDRRNARAMAPLIWFACVVAGTALVTGWVAANGRAAPEQSAEAGRPAALLPPAQSIPAPATPAVPLAPTTGAAAAPMPNSADAGAPPASTLLVPTGSMPAPPDTAQRSPAVAKTLAAPRSAVQPRLKPAATALAAGPRTGVLVPVAATPTGSVQLAISPWGQVEVDGSPAGIAPPLTRLTLPEGTHTITVRNEDFPPYTTTVQVLADKPLTLRHRFAP